MNSLIGKVFYRPEVDGLRALAIAMVVLYHAGFGFPGGYIGVDVFFVISGYLITSLIWRDLELGRFSFIEFWERRARRIAPALIVVLLFVVITSCFILLPNDFVTLGKATISQILLAANIFSYSDGGYFGGDSAEKPLLHTWSLAVEEQFYLFVPLMLWLFFKYFPHKRRTTCIILLGVPALISLALSVYGVTRNQTATFYLLPTRAWELFAGSIVAFLPAIQFRQGKRLLSEMVSLLGLALIVVPACNYSESTLFPGTTALAPVIGCALIIWSNKREQTAQISTLVGTIFSHPWIVAIGMISYSLYLWHWPLLAFAHYLSIGEVPVTIRAGIVIASVLLSTLSWKFVETPFRKKKIAAGRSIFIWTGCGFLLLLILGVAVLWGNGFSHRMPMQAVTYSEAKTASSFRNELVTADITAEKLPVLGDQSKSKSPVVLVWGDSHAMSLMEAFHLYLKNHHLCGVAATHSSTAPVLNGWYQVERCGLNAETVPFNNAVEQFIYKKRIKNVVLAGLWTGYRKKPVAEQALFDTALVKTVQRLTDHGVSVTVMLDVPIQHISVPQALSRSYLTGQNLTNLLATPKEIDQIDGFSMALIHEIETAGARILNPKEAFLSEDKKYYIIEKEGNGLYFDNQHLSTHGARLVILPYLEKNLRLVQ